MRYTTVLFVCFPEGFYLFLRVLIFYTKLQLEDTIFKFLCQGIFFRFKTTFLFKCVIVLLQDVSMSPTHNSRAVGRCGGMVW